MQRNRIYKKTGATSSDQKHNFQSEEIHEKKVHNRVCDA